MGYRSTKSFLFLESLTFLSLDANNQEFLRWIDFKTGIDSIE